jgi:outer membrane protein assembly factor BamB
MTNMRWTGALIVSCFWTFAACADDWPQWLGPHRNAVTSESVASWKTAPQIVWHVPVGEGHSSPIVANGTVFLHFRVRGKDTEEIQAFDAQTGKVLWTTPYPRTPFKTPFGDGPRSTPCVVGKRLFAVGITGVLTCCDVASGKTIWQKDLLKEFKAPNLRFGVSCSPLVIDDKVLINVIAPGASIVAFRIENGDVAWKSGDDPASYSSPITIGTGNQRQVVFLTQKGLVGLRPGDGEVLWKHPLVDLLSESSTTPVLAGDILLASSVTFGSIGLELKPTVKQLWKNSELTCYFSTPVPIDQDHVYLVTGRLLPPPKVTLHCIDARTGKDLWTKPDVGRYHASLIRTSNKKLLMLDDSGNLILLEPDTKQYRELARAKVCGPTWAHAALANGKLYVRDEKELICVELGR